MRMRSRKLSHILLIAFLGISTALVYRPGSASAAKGALALGDLPRDFAGWTSIDMQLSDDIVAALGTKDYLVREYRSGEKRVTLYITYFDRGSGALTHNPEKCYTASGWTFLDKKTVTLPNTKQAVLQSTIARGEDRQIVVYWYQVRGRVLVSKGHQIWSVVWRALAGKQTYSLVVSVSARVGGSDAGATEKDLTAFSEQIMGELAQRTSS